MMTDKVIPFWWNATGKKEESLRRSSSRYRILGNIQVDALRRTLALDERERELRVGELKGASTRPTQCTLSEETKIKSFKGR